MLKRELNKLPVLVTVKEMAKVLKIAPNTAYGIIYREDFYVFNLGPNKRILKYELIEWIRGNIDKS